MGQLSREEALDWEHTKKLLEHVREHGIMQFINLYKKLKDRPNDELKWGDEIEYAVVKFDDLNETAKVHAISHILLPKLTEKEENNPEECQCLWRPEYSAHQLECIPAKPYGKYLSDFRKVEANMRLRRLEALEILGPNESLMTLTSFPRLGCHNSIEPEVKPTPQHGNTCSLFLSEKSIFLGHCRWRTVKTNLIKRRKERMALNLPIFRDINVPKPFKDDVKSLGADANCLKYVKDDHIYMDTVGFGMGCCCLQVTMQAKNLQEACVLHDQLTAFTPIMVALTAAAPTFRGYLVDCDSRYIATRDSADDRTPGERGVAPLKPGERLMRTSRNGSVEWYLSEEGQKYNDVPLEYDDKWVNLLLNNGIEKPIAQHIAHLFCRDCILITPEQLGADDDESTDCFESLQGTTWRTMRFKPPPINSDIGWRVEFRSLDIQLTDFENSAAVCFIILLSRVILSYNLNTLIPLSKVEDNMTRSQKRDAVNKEKLWFRKNIMEQKNNTKDSNKIEDEYGEFTVDEIMNGKEGVIVGVLPLVRSYLDNMDVDVDTYHLIQRYINLYEARSKGKLMTPAAWIRKQIVEHPFYKEDSVINEKINYDLLRDIHEIGLGLKDYPEVVGTNAPLYCVNGLKQNCCKSMNQLN